MTFDLAAFINLAVNILAAFGAVASFYFRLRGDLRSYKESHDALERKVDDIQTAINDGQWISRGDIDRLLNEGNQTHKRQDEDIRSLRDRHHELSNRLNDLVLDIMKRRGE